MPSAPAHPRSAPEVNVVMDDDSVVVPAPDASVFLHKPEYAPKRVKIRVPLVGLKFRQTAIPILLTGGSILIALSALHFLWIADNDPMVGVPGWLVGVMIALGIALWGLAALNMLSVKHMLAQQPPRPQKR